MLKTTLLWLGIIAVWGGASVQRGCRDVQHAFWPLSYHDIRDMRRSVSIAPQKVWLKAPDSLSVPTVGRELWNPGAGREPWNSADDPAERQRLDKTFVNPVASDDSSIARGERKYIRTCVPCHGAEMKGDGPVIAKYIPPPDLLGPLTRGRSDGYIYSYLRHGGAVMPNYGAMITSHEACDLINYIRYRQKTNPR